MVLRKSWPHRGVRHDKQVWGDLGHRYRFTSDGPVMSWSCERGCGAAGSKVYSSAADARRYARAFDREDRRDLGNRAPLLGMFPLRAAHLPRRMRSGR
ncbi:hypothetical protein [Amycolatopsis sp. NPDC051371]|uniref:hypothetical protein n=1 Tax=Amycolatopsis sp. NPDC051371 TaxID=3155800 RepID=UPI003437A3BE